MRGDSMATAPPMALPVEFNNVVHATDEDNNPITVEVSTENKGILHFQFTLDGKILHCGKRGDKHHYMFNTTGAGATRKQWHFYVSEDDHLSISEFYRKYGLYEDAPPPVHPRSRAPGVSRMLIVRTSTWKMHPYWRVRL